MKKTEHTIDRFRSTWNSKRIASLLALMLLVTWLMIPAAVFAQEPTPRATPTPMVLLELTPKSGMPGQMVQIRGYGIQGAAQVNVTWDGESLLDDISVRADGTFETQFEIPSDTAGEHLLRVMVEGDPDPWAEAVFELYLPTATPTATNTATVPPTSTPRPTNTLPPTPIPPPTSTPLATMTATVRPTLRPATPIIPTSVATATYVYRAPTSTKAPVYVTPALPATSTPFPTNTPLPVTATETTTPATETALPANTSAPSGTETAPVEQTATATSTTTVSLAAAASATPTATITPLATDGELANTGIGPFVMVLAGGVLLGAGALGLRHLRANLLV